MLGCPDVTRRACMRQRKCPSQLAWTLNWLYPASSQVQSLFNVWLSPCLNRAAHCHDTHTHSRVYFTIIQIILIVFAESCAGTTLQTPAAWWGAEHLLCAVGHSTHASYISQCWTTAQKPRAHIFTFSVCLTTQKLHAKFKTLDKSWHNDCFSRRFDAVNRLSGHWEVQTGVNGVTCGQPNMTLQCPSDNNLPPQTNTGTLMHIQNYNNKYFRMNW